MKSCPTCNRTYPDDNLAFCLMDGAVLSAPYDPSDTERHSSPRGSNAPATEILIAPTVAAEKRSPLQSTIRAPAPQVSRLDSKSQLNHTPERQEDGMLRRAFLLRGLLGIILGALAFVSSTISHEGFVIVSVSFVAYALFGGILSIAAGVSGYKAYQTGWLLLVEGLFAVIAGLIIFITLQTHLPVLGWMLLWPLLTGALQIGAAIQLRKHLDGTWLLALAGVVSMVYGLALYADLVFGIIALNLGFVGLFLPYLVICGVLLLVFGLRIRHPRSRSN